MSNIQREKLLKALIEIGQELASATELDDLLGRILRISKEVFNFQNAIIRLLDPDRQTLVTAASYGYPEAVTRHDIPVGLGVMGKAARACEPILVADVTTMADYIPGIHNARCELAVPIQIQDRLIGVFSVESDRPGAFTEADIEPLVTMAAQAAIAIDNARLYGNLRSMSSRYRELHQFNERILKSANLGIYTIDADLHITSWNRKMAELSGVVEADALGQNIFRLFPSLEAEGFADRVRRVLERGEPEKLRLAHRNLRGQLRIQKRRITPLKDGEQTVGAVVIVEDVTEFRRLLDQTIQSEKLAEIGRLTAGIAHEINNPLSVLSYAAQLLQREENLNRDQAELVERIDSEVERIKTLTGGLLSFSSPRQARKHEVDLNEIFRDVLRLVRHELNRQSIRLVEEYGDIPAVQADPNKLKQVFINLVMNAVQAMGREGTLSISTSPVGGEEVELAVRDTGGGIPAELQAQIFEPFFTTKKDGEGTGLGLYICKNIVSEHQGRLAIDSLPGRGTTFRVVLPVGELLAEWPGTEQDAQ